MTTTRTRRSKPRRQANPWIGKTVELDCYDTSYIVQITKIEHDCIYGDFKLRRKPDDKLLIGGGFLKPKNIRAHTPLFSFDQVKRGLSPRKTNTNALRKKKK